MGKCKDCDRPLTTYQGINQRPEDAEVYCEYCEANPPTHDDIVDHVTAQVWGEMDPNEYVDFGASKSKLGLTVDPMYPWREPPLCYVSLHADDPEHDGTEISDLIHPARSNGYSRQPTTFSTPQVGVSFNERRAVWVADKGWPRITNFGVYDAKTGGNLLFHAPLNVPMDTEEGDTFQFHTNAITMKIS